MDEPLLADLAAAVTVAGKLAGKRARAGADVIRHATAARWVGIYAVADGTVTNLGWSGPAPPAHPVFPVDQGLTSHAVRSRAVAVSNDVAGDPRYLTNQDDSGSDLIVPVVASGRVIGTLDVESDAVGAFGGADIARYESLARALVALWTS